MPKQPPLEAIGSSNGNMVERCAASPPPAPDPRRRDDSLLALSFSGGGWRASLAAAGLLRFVAEAGLLSRVGWVSSVSGGSVTNGVLAVARERLAAEGLGG